eukprot:COSAG02_NODE_5924_length_3938_cov_4.300078_5_plen_67_part_00
MSVKFRSVMLTCDAGPAIVSSPPRLLRTQLPSQARFRRLCWHGLPLQLANALINALSHVCRVWNWF